MASTWEISSGNGIGVNTSASITRYIAVPGSANGQATEANNQVLARESYTLAKLLIRVITNATTADSTVVSRKNSANGAMSITIASATTGVFEDTVNSDSLVTGDLFDARIIVGAGGSLAHSIVSFTLAHASADISILGSSDADSFSATSFYALSGYLNQSSTEARAGYTFRTASTLSNLRIYVGTNTRTDATTVRTRVNVGNGAQSVSVGASTTGAFEDAVNTDSVAVADEVNLQAEILAGTGNITITTTCLESASAGQQVPVTDPTLNATGVDSYYPPFGNLVETATELNTELTARIGFTAKNMFVYIGGHGASNGVNIYLRKNETNTVLTVSIAASTTGAFEDLSNSVAFVSGDEYNWFLDHGGGAGTISIASIGFEMAQVVVQGQPSSMRILFQTRNRVIAY